MPTKLIKLIYWHQGTGPEVIWSYECVLQRPAQKHMWPVEGKGGLKHRVASLSMEIATMSPAIWEKPIYKEKIKLIYRKRQRPEGKRMS